MLNDTQRAAILKAVKQTFPFAQVTWHNTELYVLDPWGNRMVSLPSIGDETLSTTEIIRRVRFYLERQDDQQEVPGPYGQPEAPKQQSRA